MVVVADSRTGELRLYSDGHLCGQVKTESAVPISLEGFLVGAGSAELILPPLMDDNFQGLIDELRIWRRSLPASEISADMEAS